MSINVNVTGNPININRGKLIMNDPNFDKTEFQKRRLIRLQQVRQQSKDTAEAVRNKVRQQKSKQLSEIEKDGEKELKKWQTKKLLSLQQQYCKSHKNIGLGHTQANIEQQSDNAVLSKKKNNDQIAKEGGDKAFQKLQFKKQEEKLNKKKQLEQKQFNKNVENARSNLVADLNNSKNKSSFKRKKTISTDINICSRLTSESEPEDEKLSALSTHYTSDADPHENVGTSQNDIDKAIIEDSTMKHKSRKCYSPPLSCYLIDESSSTPSGYSIDTRISDRIKRHRYKPFDCNLKPNMCNVDKIKVVDDPPNTVKDLGINEQKELPSKPTLTLRTAEPSSQFKPVSGTSTINKVRYYDHDNRFVKQYIPETPIVRKIDVDTIEVCPSTHSDTEVYERRFKQDRDVHICGQKALKKQKIHRNYQEMMEQLPQLQRQERLASICSNKQTHHMFEDRLKQFECKRQNRLKNAYKKLIPKQQTITIPSKEHPKISKSTDLPFQAVKIDVSKPTTSLGTWEFNRQPLTCRDNEFTIPRQANNKIISEACETEEKRKNLQEMLKSLTFHRNRYAKKLAELPESNALYKLLSDLGPIDELIESSQTLDKECTCVEKKCQNQEKKDSLSHTMDNLDARNTTKEQSRMSKYHTQCTSPGSSPPQKVLNSSCNIMKNKCEARPQKVLVLQNTSTQTTTAEKKDEHVDVKAGTIIKEADLRAHSSGKIKICECNTELPKRKDLCEIVIKINDEGKHQISVAPDNLKDNIIITAESNSSEESTRITTKSCNKSKEDRKHTEGTWRECQNSTYPSTTYYCPPEHIKAPITFTFLNQTISNVTPRKPKCNQYASDILKNKPEQSNLAEHVASISTTSGTSSIIMTNQNLLTCIRRLLTMSRSSVEDLPISSVSEVSTPSSSIVNMQSNTLKQNSIYKNDLEDFENQCKDIHYNSLESLNGDARTMSLDEYAAENYSGILSAYNKMTKNCAEKIENLAFKIEKVRLEKLNMLDQSSKSGSNKENSTKYLDLPNQSDNEDQYDSSFHQQEELNKQLLEIDYNFAEKLKKMSPTEIKAQYPINSVAMDKNAEVDVDKELLNRFQNLKKNRYEKFEPILGDIPQLPKYEAPRNNHVQSFKTNGRSKPPPSRGLTIACRFNNNVNEIPHELSTILETDSVLSSRLQHSKSTILSNGIKTKPKISINFPSETLLEQQTYSSNRGPDILAEIVKDVKDLQKEIKNKHVESDSSSSELENIEKILKELGMGWAVATLHKTQEALALTSSSSSSNILENQGVNVHNNCQGRSNASTTATFSSEMILNLSSIPASGSSNHDKTSRRTSTPIQNFNTNKFKTGSCCYDSLTTESDLSSIKANSNDVNFYSLNEDTIIKNNNATSIL